MVEDDTPGEDLEGGRNRWRNEVMILPLYREVVDWEYKLYDG